MNPALDGSRRVVIVRIRAAKPSLNVLLDVVQQTIGVNDALLVTLFEPVRTAVIRVVDRTAFLRVIRISKSRVKRAQLSGFCSSHIIEIGPDCAACRRF
jgi:hypothetical protein